MPHDAAFLTFLLLIRSKERANRFSTMDRSTRLKEKRCITTLSTLCVVQYSSSNVVPARKPYPNGTKNRVPLNREHLLNEPPLPLSPKTCFVILHCMRLGMTMVSP